MTREDFIRKCALMGIGATILPQVLTSCKKEDIAINFDGKVLIIGAGSAGLMAGYTLKQYGIDFEIIEATSVFGGRVKKTADFADFPIDLGAEWIHDNPSVFADLINDKNVDGNIGLIPYQLETMYSWEDNTLKKRNWQSPFYGEYKFKSSTWYDFFDQYIVPQIADKITFNSPIELIDYSASKIAITNTNGDTFEGDKLIVTVPTTILKNESISFEPPLPSDKKDALSKGYMPDGIKVFIEFKEQFYPDIVTVSPVLSGGSSDDEKIFYDATFKKDTSKNILGLFNIGNSASAYTSLNSDAEIIARILEELDEMFDGKATKNYVKHVIQNWSAEPFVQGSYTFFTSDATKSTQILKEPLDNKVYFAGEALAPIATATVHGAGRSGREVSQKIIQGE